ncbi:MAG: hypothetical protein HQL60_00770 [Magnetococcales bacterium]|nr:hypothetical protein [Magnetococcales bacterium]
MSSARINRHWLIFSYASNTGSASANHIDDRLPVFVRCGITPLLISGMLGERMPCYQHYRVPSFGPSGWRTELRWFFRRNKSARSWPWRLAKILATIILLPFYLLEKLIVDLDNGWTWFPLAFIRGWQLSRRYAVEQIYTTGGSVSAHLAGGVLAAATGIPWVAEFQDPLVHEEWLRSFRSLFYHRIIERWICRQANRIVFLTEAALVAAQRRVRMEDRGVFIYPGVPVAKDVINIQPDLGVLRFAHFGSLGKSRNLDVFLNAICLLISHRPELRDLYRLDIYGNLARDCRASLDAFPWPEKMTYHGVVTRDAAREAMLATQVLLLIQNVHPVSRYTIPSKFYEYLNVGRTILGLTFENKELDAMIIKTGHYCAPADDPQQIQLVLEKLFDQWLCHPESLQKQSAVLWPVEVSVARLINLLP